MAWWLAFIATAAVLAVPLFLTEVPPLLDYPNHLTRMGLFATGLADPVLSEFYTANWGIQPNMGLDLVVPPLARVMSLEWAGKVFVYFALVLPVLGACALHRALFLRRSYWPLASALVAYNGMFFAGFVNALVGAGIALLGGALWQYQANRGVVLRLVCAAVIALAVFFCHIVAFAFFGLLLASLELGRPGGLIARVVRLVWLVVVFAVPALLFLRAPLRGEAPNVGGGVMGLIKGYYWALASSPIHAKWRGLESPFLTYDWRLDTVAAGLLVAALVVWAVRGQLRVSPGGAIAFLGVMVVYPFVPFVFMDAAWVDQRLPILAAFALFACTLPVRLSLGGGTAWATAFAAVIAVRVAAVGVAWSAHDADIADFRRVVAPVQPGQKVLVVRPELASLAHPFDGEPAARHFMIDSDSLTHVPSLLVIERRAFMPLLFSDPIKQPLRVRPPYDRLARVDGAPPFVRALSAPTETDLSRAPYLAHWRDDFDWVLLLRPGLVPDAGHLLPGELEPEGTSQIAALYKVIR